MSVFDIPELRRYIFSYVYPTKVTKGMWIEVIDTPHKPFLCGRISKIHDIVKSNKGNHTIVFLHEADRSDSMWYKVYTYIYPDAGDTVKVVQYN